MIRASLTAVPRRWPLFLAKASCCSRSWLPLSVLVCLASFLIGQALAGNAGAALTDPGVLRAVLGAAVYPVATALIGLGVGALLRHAAGSITVFVGGFLIIPALLPAALPARLQDDTLRFLPIAAGQAIYTIGGESGPVRLLSPAAGGVVLTLWVLAMLHLRRARALAPRRLRPRRRHLSKTDGRQPMHHLCMSEYDVEQVAWDARGPRRPAAGAGAVAPSRIGVLGRFLEPGGPGTGRPPSRHPGRPAGLWPVPARAVI